MKNFDITRFSDQLDHYETAKNRYAEYMDFLSNMYRVGQIMSEEHADGRASRNRDMNVAALTVAHAIKILLKEMNAGYIISEEL